MNQSFKEWLYEEDGDFGSLLLRGQIGESFELLRIAVLAKHEEAMRGMLTPQRMFPIQRQRDVPGPTEIAWEIAEKVYAVYASQYGHGQSLERLAERGGFGPGECDMLYPQWREETDKFLLMKKELAAERQRSEKLVAVAKEAFIILEALRISVKWELSADIRERIGEVAPKLMQTLEAEAYFAEKEKRDANKT